MKELTIEEKAKAYDEALKRAIKHHNNDGLTLEQYKTIDIIFPELKESKESKDERIRKALISVLKSDFEKDTTIYDISVGNIIAWLEKQGESYTKRDVADLNEFVKEYSFNIPSDIYNLLPKEKQSTWINEIESAVRAGVQWLEKQGEQKVNYTTLVETGNGGINALVTKEITNGCDDEQKSFDYENANIPQRDFAHKVEPKFKVGDWITNGDYTWKIVEIKPLDYILQSQDGNIVDDTISHVDEQFHSFTIQDAKEGDVLYHENKYNGIEFIVMNKGINECGNIDSYFRYNSSNGFGIDIPSVLSVKCDNITPATKEQRDLLFQKMKESGYEWDAEKKKLKLLITNGGDFESENCKQKPSWNEKDESHLIHCVRLINNAEGCSLSEQENAIEWLKSLKDRYTWKPSDEQMKVLISEVEGWTKGCPKQKVLESLYNDLKNLK